MKRYLIPILYILLNSLIWSAAPVEPGTLKLKDGTKIMNSFVGLDFIKGDDNKTTVKALFRGADGMIIGYEKSELAPESQGAFNPYFVESQKSSRGALLEYYKAVSYRDNMTPKYYIKNVFPLSSIPKFPNTFETGWMHAKAPKMDRESIPNHQLSELGFKSGISSQMALVNILLWWEKNGLIELPQMDSNKKKMLALYKAVNLKKSVSLSRVELKNIGQSLWKLNFKSFKDQYAIVPYNQKLQHYIFDNERDLELIKKLATKHFGTCLCVSIHNNKGKLVGSQLLNVISVTDNEINFQAWGTKYRGQLIEAKFDVKGDKLPRVELSVSSPGTLPSWFKEQQLKMTLSDVADGVFVIMPFQSIKAGKLWQAPLPVIKLRP